MISRMKQLSHYRVSVMFIAVAVLVLGGCAAMQTTGETAGPDKAEEGYKYFCACGPECDCGTTADKPGNCVCDKPMVYKKVLREDATKFYRCPCPGDCTCDKLNPNNPNRCECGELLQGFPKKGAYVCDCGPECDCGTVSQKPGNCVCGAPLKQVE